MKRLLALVLTLATSTVFAQSTTAPEIAAIDVRLFLSHSGALSAPIGEDAALWNTIIGGGFAGEPSTASLVTVLVRGPRSGFNARKSVVLRVRYEGKDGVKSLTKPLSVFDKNGTQYVGFWLPETGCQPVHLEASISGSRLVMKREIPFKCGE